MAIDLLSCRDWEEVRRLAETKRSIGRRTIAAIDEEYQLTEARRAARSSSPPADIPSSSTRAGPSTSAGVGPSSSAGAGPFTFVGAGSSSSLPVPPSASAMPPSPAFDPHHPLESIDDYTIVMDDVDTTQSATPSVPTTSVAGPPQEDITPPLPLMHYTRKRAISRFDPSAQPPAHLQLPHDPLPHTQPTTPQTQPLVQEGQRNPPRNRRVPSCGTH